MAGSFRARLRTLRSLPPFLAVLLRSVVGAGKDPSTEVAPAMRGLVDEAGRLPDDALIAQRSPIDPEVTFALAAGCRGTARRVLVEWPTGELATEAGRTRFARWHREVIRRGLLSQVVVSRQIDPAAQKFALVYAEGHTRKPRSGGSG